MAIIDEIKEAEKKAQKIKDDAKAAARADAETIETEALSEAAARKKAAREEADALISSAGAEAEEARKAARSDSDAECSAIRAQGEAKIGAAADSIFERAIRL